MDEPSELLPGFAEGYPRLRRPPDRFLLALGRVSYLMASLDSILAEILVGILAGPHKLFIGKLVDGETTDWKLNKLKSFIELDAYQSANDDVTLVIDYLGTRVSALSGHIKQRNRLMHSTWSERRDGQFVSTQYRRHGDPVEIIQSVDQIERFGDSLESEVHLLGAAANVIILNDPIIVEKLGVLWRKFGYKKIFSDLGEPFSH
jgi:hypothetical protein